MASPAQRPWQAWRSSLGSSDGLQVAAERSLRNACRFQIAAEDFRLVNTIAHRRDALRGPVTALYEVLLQKEGSSRTSVEPILTVTYSVAHTSRVYCLALMLSLVLTVHSGVDRNVAGNAKD